MIKAISLVSVIVLACGVVAGQNTNSSTPAERQRTASPTNRSKPPATETQKQAAAEKAPAPAGAEGVLAAFNSLLDGIRHASVNEVMSVYWNSSQLNMFNYNGTVTKGWQQVKKNRESSYPEIKDVKLEVRDVSVTMLGRDGATVTCLWTQSQNYKGTPETVSGRMTLVFKRVGNAWKAIHLHSSPDNPNPAVIPASEKPSPSPSPTP
ncbi:MAG TPA: nuclear transport factor 2 family protein [Pyrinomonadaceae bacterium]|nr:nuclear transport factor 2 family protein [Pyrinomonadaceae bacterium]